MSKIEEVLKKAREIRAAQATGTVAAGKTLIPGKPAPAAPTGQVASVPRNTVAARLNARDEIARMASPWQLSEERLAEHRIISQEMADGRVANAFRELRTKIIQKCQGYNAIIMVTSVSPGDGTSFVARNLATAFTFDESKTALLLDCNLTNPSSFPGQPGAAAEQDGLTDYLERNSMQVEQIIHPAGLPRFRLIPAGDRREIPAEHFTSVKMRELLQSLKQRYPERFIIVDSPSIAESADARILSELCDYVLLVIPYGKVTELQIATSVKAIGENKLLCTVLNNMPQLPRLTGKGRLHSWLERIRGLFRTPLSSSVERSGSGP